MHRPIAVLTVALALSAAAAGPASAESPAPWWGATTGARPTNLAAATGADEIQVLTVTAEGGEALIIDPAVLEEIDRGEVELAKARVALVPYDATGPQMREAVERAMPERTVLVSEQTAGETRTYQLTFPNQELPPLFVSAELAEEFHGTPLSGPGASATVEELTKGHESEDTIVAAAEDRGDAATSGAVTVKDALPPGMEPVAIKGVAGGNLHNTTLNRGPVDCTVATLTCHFEPYEPEAGRQIHPSLRPYEEIEVDITVRPAPGAVAGEHNTVTVSGGGATHPATASRELELGSTERFGFEDYQLIPESPGGAIDTQAGSHPFQLTNITTLNAAPPLNLEGELTELDFPKTVGLTKDVIAELPPGFIGNPTPFAQCTDAQFGAFLQPGGHYINECPASSAIGVATVSFTQAGLFHYETVSAPIFNVTPRAGEPARFGFKALGIASAFLDTSVRTGGSYGVTVAASTISQQVYLDSVKLTFWGVPGDPRHDHQRGWECLEEFGTCETSSNPNPPPFLVMPTNCQAPFTSTVRGDSWAPPGGTSEIAEPLTYTLPEAVDGCNRLPFSPSIRATPDGTAASSPTGMSVDVHVPQEAVLNSTSLAQSAVKDITVALPEGVAINPSGGDGLQACSENLAGFTGISEAVPGQQIATFTPGLPEPETPGTNICPDASKIGTVEITTPLLPPGQHLKGFVYLATQNANPFGSLIALYLIAKDPISGVVVKLTGATHLSPTGQIIATFENSPQLAFEDAELHFFGGERAPLATPAHCGAYTTNASFAPWSENEPVSSQSTFNITSGPNGSACPGASLPFSPSLTAGSPNINAGAFSPLDTTISRADGNQNIQTVQLHMAPGMSGILAGVPLCPEAQANEGTCGAGSLIGETTVSAGVGNDPVSVKGGKVYLTEKYAGAPFGLSIVNPVKAGPFDLEHDTSNPANNPPCDCVVVRAKIEINPTTAALTITTDPSGPHAIPHLIDGIPVQIKAVNVTVNRPGFTFNPTNCNPQSITGTIGSVEGATSPVSVPFQVTNCAALKFAPKFQVSTSGKSSKAKGASLTVKLSYPAGSQGTQANIARVKVELPKQLPSQLKTLQKACLAAVFEANPASCPAESVVGHATVHTPLLPVPLTGPAYFVSHGGEAFPDLTLVLQGYGVTVELVGSTFISKAGITSSTFKATPDVPFNAFELTLPQGKYAALTTFSHATAGGSLCGQALKMPTEFRAQNGMEIHESTPITVTGCPPSVSITKTAVKGNSVAVTVKLGAGGTVKITGRGLRTTTKRGLKAGTRVINVPLTAAGRAARSHRGKLKIQASLTVSGRTGTATTTLRA